MNFGTLIIKPDFFEDIRYLNYFEELLQKNDCRIINCYAIKNYTEINKVYRKNDLKKRFRNKLDYDKNFYRSMIAYNSYNLLDTDNVGLLLIIKQKKKYNNKEFYNTLQSIKKALRNFIEVSRNFVYLYLTDSSNTPKLIKAKHEEFDNINNQYEGKVKLAFINGVHLEDFELFKKNFCFKIFKKLGMINKYNEISPNDISLLFKQFNSEIDLHIHSSISDGKYTSKEIRQICNNLDIKYASITDHDVISNDKMINKFVNGVEFNTVVNNRKCHILCYDMDINNKHFHKLLQVQKSNRISQLLDRVKQLKDKYNIILKDEDIEHLIKNNHFSRDYLADLVVKYKYCNSKNVALKDYVNKLKHGRYLIEVKILRALIHRAHGVIVLAHPLGDYKHRISIDEFEENSKSLLKIIDGIECFYSNYTNEEIYKLYQISKKYNLIPTCGSDFHGTRQTNEYIGKISNETLSFDNMCNYLATKRQIKNSLFRRNDDTIYYREKQ